MEIYQDEYSFNTIRNKSKGNQYDEYAYHTNLNFNNTDDSDCETIEIKPDVIIITDSDEGDDNDDGAVEDEGNEIDDESKQVGGDNDIRNHYKRVKLHQTMQEVCASQFLVSQFMMAGQSSLQSHSNGKRKEPFKIPNFGMNFLNVANNARDINCGDDEDDDDDTEADRLLILQAARNVTSNCNDALAFFTGGPNGNRKNSSNYECRICGKEVVSKYNLKRHMMIHTGEKPYNCEICNKGFRECSDLRKHKKVHVNGNKIFKCTTCTRQFPTYKANKCYFCEEDTDNNDLVSTTTVGIKNSLEILSSKYRCLYCSCTTFSSTELKLHIQTFHSGLDLTCSNINRIEADSPPKMYKCTICEKSFRSKEFLQIHAIAHNNDSQ